MATKKYPLGGTALNESDFSEGKVLFQCGEPNARYAWDTGKAIGRYLDGLKKGKILGVKCKKCRRIVVPPRMFCERCFGRIDGFVELKTTGRVNTFSLCYVTWDMKKLKKPMIPAVIEIDGTSNSEGIMHLLGEVAPEDVKIGMKVQAVWRPAKERKGAITDIKYFKPV